MPAFALLLLARAPSLAGAYHAQMGAALELTKNVDGNALVLKRYGEEIRFIRSGP